MHGLARLVPSLPLLYFPCSSIRRQQRKPSLFSQVGELLAKPDSPALSLVSPTTPWSGACRAPLRATDIFIFVLVLLLPRPVLLLLL